MYLPNADTVCCSSDYWFIAAVFKSHVSTCLHLCVMASMNTVQCLVGTSLVMKLVSPIPRSHVLSGTLHFKQSSSQYNLLLIHTSIIITSIIIITIIQNYYPEQTLVGLFQFVRLLFLCCSHLNILMMPASRSDLHPEMQISNITTSPTDSRIK